MLINDNQYLSVIESIKTEISKAQYNAALQVNKELTVSPCHYERKRSNPLEERDCRAVYDGSQ